MDSSALLKRCLDEPESADLEDALEAYVGDSAALVTSSLTKVEMSRAIHRAAEDLKIPRHVANEIVEVAMSGVGEKPIGSEVRALARHIGPATLRSLDSIHLATAVLLESDLVITYDARLISACGLNGLAVASP